MVGKPCSLGNSCACRDSDLRDDFNLAEISAFAEFLLVPTSDSTAYTTICWSGCFRLSDSHGFSHAFSCRMGGTSQLRGDDLLCTLCFAHGTVWHHYSRLDMFTIFQFETRHRTRRVEQNDRANGPEEIIRPNEPMELIPVPSALMSCFLLAQEPRHKQAGIPHRGR
jgi:hypothetical protein